MTPTFSSDGFLESCFQNPSENSDAVIYMETNLLYQSICSEARKLFLVLFSIVVNNFFSHVKMETLLSGYFTIDYGEL